MVLQSFALAYPKLYLLVIVVASILIMLQSSRMLLHGNEALSLGAMVAGCKFISGYPMTPASSILEYIADKGRQYGVVAVHVEDEIAAINMAIGAGYTGVRAMVATSGGGFSLMVEGLALASMTETPVVVVLGQRPGPATGMATVPQGISHSALQPVAVFWLAPRQGPSQSDENCRSGRMVPSPIEPPRPTEK